jgi:competence protein ComEC
MRWRTRWGRVSFIVVVLALGLTYIWHDAAVRTGRPFALTLLDVGHGQCAVVELPTGETMLFDAGAQSPGAAEVPAGVLWANHEDGLDAVCISHMNQDHVSFLPYLARRFAVGKVLVPRAGELTDYGAAVRAWVRRKGPHLETLGEGDGLRAGAFACEVLHPNARFVTAGSTGENSKSLVLRCEYEGLTVLLPGDVEDDAIRRLSRDRAADLRTDVLVLPHHGHYHPGLAEFIKLVGPHVALVSGPAGEVDARTADLLRERGVPLWITGSDGAIIITLESGRAEVLGWVSGRTMEFAPAAPSTFPERSGDG